MKSNEAIKQQSTLPPLRIHHLLVLMAVPAIQFSAAKSNRPELFTLYVGDAFSSFASFILESLSITVLVFGAYWQISGYKFFTEPGHGFLLLQSFAIAWKFLRLTIASIIYSPSATYDTESLLYRIAELPFDIDWPIYSTVTVLILILSAYWITYAGKWRKLYIVLGLLTILRIVCGAIVDRLSMLSEPASDWLRWLNLILTLLPAVVTSVCLIAFTAREVRNGVVRHWSHSAGVGCLLLSDLVFLGTWIEFLISIDFQLYPR